MLRIATRGSALALAQARWVAARIETELSEPTELVPIKTSGDRLQGVSLAKVGGKGLFVKEIEEALREGRADLAVHSAKDLPARLAQGLAVVAWPQREDPRDALVARERGTRLETLRPGARLGTGSARRSAQLRALRPDLELVPLRGNVTTRLQKLEAEGLDAVVLACAGLLRLGLAERIDERIAAEALLPAVAQGTLAVEAHADSALGRALAALSDAAAERAALAERAFLARLEGDCNVPLAALAEAAPGGLLRVRGLVSSADGRTIVRGEACGRDAVATGQAAAEEVLGRGGDRVLAALRREAVR
ncbi:MAG TPA: hydroxymethylbilane synthase [Deltaproteobacteria bacterium]|nr:hydroxymethylbilane synthase [Deltaproteobacteria bacterium]